MGTHILDAFFITLGLDTRDYEKGEREINERSSRLRQDQKKTFDDIERFSRKTGESVRSLSRDVVTLGLAFMGAKSISGLIGDMMKGAASADRFGQILGMNTKQIFAWRKAMMESGGQATDGDAALSAVQRAKMSYRMGQMGAEEQGIYGMLGISGDDLLGADAGKILQKLAAARDSLDPQLYASLLQQIGLPASTVTFLMQGKKSVDELIAKYAKNSSEMENLAKEQEKLQKALTDLQATLANDIAPHLTRFANWLNTVLGGRDAPKGPGTPDKPETVWSLPGWMGDLLGIKRDNGGWSVPGSKAGQGSNASAPPSSGTGKTRADRNHNPGNIVDSPWTRKQPGYAGSDGRFAKFSSPEHGFAAMEKLLANYMSQGRTSISSILSKYAPSSENDVGAYARHVSQLTGFGPNDRLGREHIPMLARAMARHEGYSFRKQASVSGLMSMHRNFARTSAPRTGAGGVTINGMTINTKATDAKGIAADFKSALNRRLATAQYDQVIAP